MKAAITRARLRDCLLLNQHMWLLLVLLLFLRLFMLLCMLRHNQNGCEHVFAKQLMILLSLAIGMTGVDAHCNNL